MMYRIEEIALYPNTTNPHAYLYTVTVFANQNVRQFRVLREFRDGTQHAANTEFLNALNAAETFAQVIALDHSGRFARESSITSWLRDMFLDPSQAFYAIQNIKSDGQYAYFEVAVAIEGKTRTMTVTEKLTRDLFALKKKVYDRLNAARWSSSVGIVVPSSI